MWYVFLYLIVGFFIVCAFYFGYTEGELRERRRVLDVLRSVSSDGSTCSAYYMLRLKKMVYDKLREAWE